jgi:hypothetical protein
MLANNPSVLTGGGVATNVVNGTFQLIGPTGSIALTAQGTNQNITLTPSGSGLVSIVSSAGNQSSILRLAVPATATLNSILSYYLAGVIEWQSGALNSDSSYRISSSGIGTTDAFVIKSSQNVLLGTPTDSSNGRLQLATHTTSAGGIGFGTDVALYRSAANELSIYTNSQLSHTFTSSGVNTQLTFRTLAGKIINLQQISAQFGVNLVIGGNGGSNEDSTLQTGGTGTLYLKTGSSPTTAVSIDSSQNTTFAGIVIHKSYTVATLPAAAAGNTYGTTFVSDATNAAGTGIGTAPTGGGAIKRAVYSTGAAWLLL